MSMYDKAFLSDEAKKLHVIRDTLEKVYRLQDILRYFDNSELLRDSLALKGGTAINLLFCDLPRLSVDLDLDFAKNLSRDEMMEERNIITNLIGKHMVANGYSLSLKTKTSHSLDSLVYDYQNAGGTKDNVKIEINYSLREHVLPLKRIRMRSDILEGDFEVLSVSPEEIYAAKTVALLSRAAPRDLYDMNYMIRFNLLNETQMEQYRKCVVFYLAVTSHIPPISIDLTMMNSISTHDIRTMLLPVCRDLDAFQLEDAKKTVGDFLLHYLSLNHDELLFLREFRTGLFRPELLFEDAETLKRVKTHPMALWKNAKSRDWER